jgi:bifunctional ADP-heptose synthase (sugar kinase/adenylyltransferase)
MVCKVHEWCARMVCKWCANGVQMVCTNGVYDLLHFGVTSSACDGKVEGKVES